MSNARKTVKTSSTQGATKRPAKKAVIASRKSCQATGTGLSHYLFTDRKAK